MIYEELSELFFWTWAAFSLIFSAVFVPDHFQRKVFFFVCLFDKSLNSDPLIIEA